MKAKREAMKAALGEWREITAIRPPMWGEITALAHAHGVTVFALRVAITRAGMKGYYAITNDDESSRKINSQVAKNKNKKETR